jgi:hypothetical protein
VETNEKEQKQIYQVGYLSADDAASIDLHGEISIVMGRAWYEHAGFTKSGNVRLSRLEPVVHDGVNRLRQINRIVSPETMLVVKLTEATVKVLEFNGLLRKEVQDESHC